MFVFSTSSTNKERNSHNMSVYRNRNSWWTFANKVLVCSIVMTLKLKSVCLRDDEM